MNGQAWRGRAACLHADVEIFYPEQGDTAAVASAQRICAGCPVVADCLRDAIDTREEHGIRGGMTPRSRWTLRQAYGRGDRAHVARLLERLRDRLDELEAADGGPPGWVEPGHAGPDIEAVASGDPLSPHAAADLGVCTLGHPVRPGNRYRNGRYPDGRTRWSCLECLHQRRARKEVAA